MTRGARRKGLGIGFVCLFLLFSRYAASALPAEIVIMRHGDKNPDEDWNHNLNLAGLKRSLALPDVLLVRYGKPQAIFAPQPKAPNGANIRSIQLITPTAIKAEVNIDTKFSVGEEKQLAECLKTDPSLNDKLVFVVWEHNKISEIAAELGIKTSKWKSTDFDSLWIIKHDDSGIAFSIEKENLGD